MKQSPVPTTTDLLRTLREAREAKRLSQEALATRLGMAQPRISLIERGRADPQLSTVLNLAGMLDLQLALVPRPLWPAVRSLIENYYTAAHQPDHPPADERPLYRLTDEPRESDDRQHDEPA